MALDAGRAAVAVAQRGEGAAHGCGCVDVHVRVAAVRLGAAAALEVGAGRHAGGDRGVREIAGFLAGGAGAVTEKVFADGEFVDVVRVVASVAEGACTCDLSVVVHR